MKKLAFFSFATLAVLLSSCADLTSVGNTEGETNTIAAVMEGVQTKTSTTDEGHFSWSEGDNIWLEATGDYVKGVLSSGAGTPNATFNYESFFGDLTGKSVYPYNTGHSVEGDVLNVVLPASYDLGSNLDNTNSPMYGVNVGGTLKFNHLAGVMRFSFKNVPAGVDRFTFTVDKKINGTFAADLTADYPVLQTEAAKVDAERTVTFNFDALANTSDIKIFVPVPLGTYESLELALYKGEESVWTYSKAVTNTINRKSLKLMPTVSMGGSIGGDIENDGTIGGDIEEGEDVYMTYLRKDEFGVHAAEVKNVTSTSCDYNIKAFTDNDDYDGSGGVYDALYFDTNLTKGTWTFAVPEADESWLDVGYDPDQNVILIQVGPNEEGAERSSKIEIRSKDTNALYYTINVIQAPEPVTYINCDPWYVQVDQDATFNNDLTVYSNAQELVCEALTDSPWISINLCKANGDSWVVEANMDVNTTTERRTADFKVYPVGKPDTYVGLRYEQYGLDVYMTYLRNEGFGSVSGISEVKNITALSCDYYLRAFADYGYSVDSGRTYDGLFFDTNLTDYTYVVPEADESWLEVGYDLSNNVILIQVGPNEEGAERRSKIEIISRDANTLYYTINVIQAPEPVTYINCDPWYVQVDQDATFNNDLTVRSNAKELVCESLTDSPWISINLCKASGDNWVVEANMTANTTTERRTAEFKVYPVGKPDTYAFLRYEQYGLDVYMTYLRKDEFGASGVAEVKNSTATSCDYTIKSFADSFASGNIYDALYFDTNLTKGTWKYVVPAEDVSWLSVGMDPDQNVILIQAGPNEGSAERSSKIEIRSKDTNTLYYTINVIQAPEPVAYINCAQEYLQVGSGSTSNNDLSVYSDAKQLVYENLTRSAWITIDLCKASGDNWVVEANISANRTTERRTAEFKVYPAGRPSTYVILTYEQCALGE